MEADMDGGLYTFPSFYAMSQHPRLRHAVVPTLQRYGGNAAVHDYVDLKKTMIDRGIDAARAQNTALYRASTRADLREAERQVRPWFIGPMGPTQGKLKDALKAVGRTAAAVVTMGASEATYWGFRALPASEVKKKIRDAANRGFDTFNEAVAEAIRPFGKVDDWRDVLDIAKVVLSAGASIAQDAIIVGIQAAVMELIEPFMREVHEVLARGLATGRRACRQAAQKLVGRMGANNVVKKVIGEIVDTLFDLALGYPPCVCEKACIQPIATSLSKVSVPYIKAIGEALKAIYPIVQGDFGGMDMPQAAPALALYAEGETPLLPNAQLPEGANKTLKAILDVLGEKNEWAIGMPEAFNRFEPYLVDFVARGKKGPYVYSSSITRHTAKYYFANPLEAKKVLHNSNKIGGLLSTVDKYLKKISKYIEYGQQAYDLYQAIDGSDLSFDLEEWNAEDFSEFLKTKVADVQTWAIREVDDYTNRAKDLILNADQIAGRMAMREANKYKVLANTAATRLDSSKSLLKQYQDPAKASSFITSLQNRAGYEALAAKDKAVASAESAYNQAKSDAKRAVQDEVDAWTGTVRETKESVTETKNKLLAPIRMFNGLGAVNAAESFMGEWMPAQIGLRARVRYNEMAMLWLQSTETERKAWRDVPWDRWAIEGIDYPAWYGKFRKSKTMKKMMVAQAAHRLPMQNLATILAAAVATKAATVPILTEVIDERGRLAGIKDLSKSTLSSSSVFNREKLRAAVAKKYVSAAQVASYTNIAKLSKIGLSVNPAIVREVAMKEGLVGQTSTAPSAQPKWLVPVAIAGAAVTGAAILTAFTTE